jgi:hypothetical protein
LGGSAARAGNSSVIHNTRRSHLAGALSVEQIAGVDAIQQEGVAGVALPVGPDRLVAQTAVGSGAGRQFRVDPRRKNGKAGETAGGQWNCFDLCPVQNVPVGRVDGVGQGCFFNRDGRGHLAYLHGRVDSGGAVGLHHDRRYPLRLKSFMRESERVTSDGKIYEIITSVRIAGLAARQRGLIAHDSHDRSRQNAARAFHDGAGDAAKGLLGLSNRRESEKHAQ